NDNASGLFPAINLYALTPGTTLYVRVWPKTSTTAGNFQICATTCTPPPIPQTACYETLTFNTSTCQWIVAGSRPVKPITGCFESASFDNNSCQWIIRDINSTFTTSPTCFGGSNGSIVVTQQPDTTIPANPGLLLSEIFTNPAGDDSPYEWVELIATDNIDFAQKPYTIIVANNGKASTKGWMQGGAPTPTNNSTYAFHIDSGKVVPGEVFYVGGSLMAPTGKKLRVRNTATQPGDGGLGSPNLNSGVLGNGGGIADGVAIFDKPVSLLDSNAIPRDALFFGTFIGDAALVDTSKGFTLPVNDYYSGGHLDTTDFKTPDPFNGYLTASGGYNASTGSYTPRTWTTASNFTNDTSAI
ncbi:MAG: hypothetical protein ACKOQ6_13940, partial [Bacteroidota bacterium]